MRRNIVTALLYTVATILIFGLAYPLAVTLAAQLFFKDKANGQLLVQNGQIVGSRIIGQGFTSAGYFHSRPSAAGAGYDATSSGGSNYGPTNQKLVARIERDAAAAGGKGADIPIDLITASGSGLDPHITPAAAEFQVIRVAGQRHVPQASVRSLISAHTEGRQLGFLGEPRVNVLELNLDLDRVAPLAKR